MKRLIRDALIRTARLLIKLGNRIDGPQVTYYDLEWQPVRKKADAVYFQAISNGHKVSGFLRR